MLANLVQRSERHLTDEALLVLASEHSSAGTKQAASAHLGSCAECRTRLHETRRVFAAWHHISMHGLLANSNPSRYGGATDLGDGFAFPWKPLSALLACCLVIVFLVTSNVVPAAKASSILSDAVKNDRSGGQAVGIEMQYAGEKCAAGASVSDLSQAKMSPACEVGLGLIRKASWPTRKPLSAAAFAAWRSSLPKKRDSVIKQANSVRVDTVTPTGFLREASLTMQTPDYRPLSLDLVFEDNARITLSEDVSSSGVEMPNEAAAAVVSSFVVPASGEPHVETPVDPLDAAEVNAWLKLDELHADNGWEATVVRSPGEVDLKGAVATSAREQQFLEAFRGEPIVKIDLTQSNQMTGADPYRAQRAFGGDSPALAQDWLEQQYPDLDDRSKFANSALDLSKTLLGRAFFLEQLKQSRAAMPSSAEAEKLSELIARKQSSLIAAQFALAATIRPLVGEVKHPLSKPLSYDDARKLDAALGSLLAASGQDSPDFEAEVNLVRGLL